MNTVTDVDALAAAAPANLFGRRDYHGKSALQRNSSHLALLGLLLFVFCVYFLLPLLSLPIPTIPDRVWDFFLVVVGIAKFQSGRADVALNQASSS